ncbi:hypothetical protein EAE96_008357 [Botrytis aclada]|nr:hypothetical protein EAE96_008357 [Botrytis aclada]
MVLSTVLAGTLRKSPRIKDGGFPGPLVRSRSPACLRPENSQEQVVPGNFPPGAWCSDRSFLYATSTESVISVQLNSSFPLGQEIVRDGYLYYFTPNTMTKLTYKGWALLSNTQEDGRPPF